MFSPKVYGSMPLTETVNTLPEGGVELLFSEELLKTNQDDYRRDNYGLGLGLLPVLSIWYKFQYMHRGIPGSRQSELGDTFLRVWYYIDDFLNRVQFGFLTVFRFPSGRNAYEKPDWQNISFGNNELKIGPVLQIDINKFHFHLNGFYIFRQGEGEGAYSGFYINPFAKETYKKFFGLNCNSDGAFLEKKRLKNDYAVFSIAINSDLTYPFIPYVEFYCSNRLYRGRIETGNIPIEGAAVNPRLVSAGFRYFVTESLYLGFYSVMSVMRKSDEDYPNLIFGMDFSLQF